MKKYRPLPAGAAYLLLLAAHAVALEVPAGTLIEIRLKAKLSTQNAKPKDPVEAVVIAPVLVNNQFAIPAGAAVRGTVEKSAQAAKPDERSTLVLMFNEIELGGATLKIDAQIAAIDNARESLDEQGQITGILPSETITGQLDAGLNKLSGKYSGLADVLSIAKNAVLKPADTGITYDAGTEFELKLKAALNLDAPGGAGPAAQVGPIPDETALADLVAGEPFQTTAQQPPKPSDVTNILLIGKEEAVQKAFADAGWSTAAGLNTQAKFETFRALAEARAPMRPPAARALRADRSPWPRLRRRAGACPP